MADVGHQELVKRYFEALSPPQNEQILKELRHDNFVEDWPQSGERIRGHENSIEIHRNYPKVEGQIRSVAGSEDQWVTTPMFTAIQVVGTGDVYTVEAEAEYPDGQTWQIIGIVRLRDGKVHRQTTYFAPSLEAPEWRAQWVERIPDS